MEPAPSAAPHPPLRLVARKALFPAGDVHKLLPRILVALPAAGLLIGFAAYLWGASGWAGRIWAAATIPVLLALLIEIFVSLRRGDVGLDIIAALSMLAALVFGEHLAAIVVALMYSGGKFLESFAEQRARREMTALLARVPRTAVRHRDGRLEEVELDAIEPGDRLLVRQGDVVPVDGIIEAASRWSISRPSTGESMPIQHKAGDDVMSGSTNVGDAFELLAARRAAESTYAAIVRLVEAAQASRRPDGPAGRPVMRWCSWQLTIALAGGAWFWTGDPIRAVAVLVVATPCPLILAVPVALVSGLSRAARHGILVKSGQALEVLARIRALVTDKTGTLTHGQARMVSIQTLADLPHDEVLRLAAALDQASKHVIAQTIVREARTKGLALSAPTEVVETAGEGIEGTVGSRRVVVGGLRFVTRKVGRRVRPVCERTWRRAPLRWRSRSTENWSGFWFSPTSCASVRKHCCVI